jgi:hypothetical protein
VEEVIPAVEPVNAVDVKAIKAAGSSANIDALATSALLVAIVMA